MGGRHNSTPHEDKSIKEDPPALLPSCSSGDFTAISQPAHEKDRMAGMVSVASELFKSFFIPTHEDVIR